jgi:hypothetical protein
LGKPPISSPKNPEFGFMRIMRLFDYATSPVGNINAMRADGAFSHSKSNLTVYALGAAFFLLLASAFGYELWIERQRIQQTAEAKAQGSRSLPP